MGSVGRDDREKWLSEWNADRIRLGSCSTLPPRVGIRIACFSSLASRVGGYRTTWAAVMDIRYKYKDTFLSAFLPPIYPLPFLQAEGDKKPLSSYILFSQVR